MFFGGNSDGPLLVLPRFPRLLWLVLLICIREGSPRRRLPAGRLAGMMSPSRALSVDDDELGIDVSPEVRAATAPDAELAGVELAPGTGHRLHGAGRRLPAGGGGDRGARCRVGRPHPLPFAGRRGIDHRRLAPGRAGPAAVPHPLQSEPGGRPRRPRRPAGPRRRAFANRRAPWSDAFTTPGRTAAGWRCSPPTALMSAAAASGAAPRSGECETCQRAGWHPRHSSTM